MGPPWLAQPNNEPNVRLGLGIVEYDMPLDDLPATYYTAWGVTNLGQHVAVVGVMVLSGVNHVDCFDTC
jgi:hypothetical protein